ncbi:uncharacterized protein LOC127096120 [Lathyrus oleraceus]|uniref:uncharacterized protein LOC127096120 n=1 Tax=Pisum sativum TaxID=3888 RepID=UPI0021CED580|nr:uncharacterized protein LOC127096120 [Pisum sativum]
MGTIELGKGKHHYRGKLYSAPADKGKQRVSDEKRPGGGETPASIKCFKCGELGHHTNECKNEVLRCFKYGKTSHHITDYRFIRGTRFTNGIPLIATIDTGATYSFISLDCVKSLGLKLYAMVESMVIDTPTNGSVATSWVCLNCPLTIYRKIFRMDLVCLPLNQLDVILRMNWLEFNCVHIKCFDKSVSFPEFVASDKLFVSTKQLDEFMKDETEVFMILASMKVESKVAVGKLPWRSL